MTGAGSDPRDTQAFIKDTRRRMLSLERMFLGPQRALPTPVGAVMLYAGEQVPLGWLEMNGTTKSRASYPHLYAKLLTRFNTGGESSTVFRLPPTPSTVMPDMIWIIKT